MLVYAIVFADGYLGGICGGGTRGARVHVLDEVCVVGLFGPEVVAVGGLLFELDDAAVGPEEEGAVEEGRGGAYDGAGDGGRAPFVAARGEEIVGYCEKAQGGGGEGGSGKIFSGDSF